MTTPTPPNIGRKALNFGRALVRHAADGFERVDDKTLATRTEACNGCPANSDGECRLCGCVISLKVTWRSERCPMELW